MSIDAALEPFGLTFRDPVPADAQVSEALRTAVYDQQRQMAMFNGRPLSELTAEERMQKSEPTETDGKDPIAVDTDPFYD
ncbi:putative ATP-grasp-modified RiPP [Pseudonocardia acaciae]|uniref:putative ATP-grasp-modified RiPP n=1 Tax=Pseudonocardia acaciae TaxID=551276 RepID=UPI00048F4337|nr:putative ATP-grasp-modified RiPP [Pseudonocardia acaciae]